MIMMMTIHIHTEGWVIIIFLWFLVSSCEESGKERPSQKEGASKPMECNGKQLNGMELDVSCNGMGWHGMQWKAIEWNGMGWDGMQ